VAGEPQNLVVQATAASALRWHDMTVLLRLDQTFVSVVTRSALLSSGFFPKGLNGKIKVSL
jgi:hypothetical protein